jgi:aryl-alcohol dehydrogenase-like predicted oxidoreductase
MDKAPVDTRIAPAQTAIRWLKQKPGVTAPIIGAHSPGQLKENLGSTGWSLSNELMARLDRASTAVVSYPYDESAEKQQREGRA